MKLAHRLHQLGSETAFAVSQAAAAHAAKGHKVYPFHIGDVNIPTAPNIIEAQQRAIYDGKTGYVPPAGIPSLRQALADDVGRARGVHYSAENVVVQPGGKPVITKFLQTVMNPGDEVLCPTPGFPIYESQIEYLGGVCKPYRFTDTGEGFAIDMDYLESQITPNTRCLIYNNCQNPTAAESDPQEVERLAALAIKHNLWVLTDDAYAEVRYAGQTHYIVSLPGMLERTVTLYTFSKKYAMTGWRLGAAIGPKPVMDAITQLNVNDESCTTNFVQWAGVEALRGDQAHVGKLITTLQDRRDVLIGGLNDIRGVTAHLPDAAFYAYANVTGAMQKLGFDNVNDFATAALEHTGVSFCTRRHFGRPLRGEKQHYIRLAYAGIKKPSIIEGIAKLKAWIEA
jgi:aspartate/methionine/tyrosine aminotransferase